MESGAFREKSSPPPRCDSDAAPPRPVAVVGAGVTGLVAAYALRRAGAPATVYEASDRVGGVIRSVREGGYLAEFGPNSLLETTTRLPVWLREIGLGERMLYSDPAAENRYLVRYGRPVLLPASPLRLLFACELFSWRAKLALLREPFLRRGPADREESVAQFVLRRLNREWLDYAINPMIAGIYAGDPERLSVRHGFPRLYNLEQKYGSLIRGQILGARERRARGEIPKQEAKKISFLDGLEELPRALAASLGEATRLRSRVEELRRAEGGWEVFGTGPAGAFRARHSAVLLAAPAYRIAELRLESEGASEDLSLLGRIVYPPVASVVLGFRRDEVEHPLDGFGMLVPAKEPFSILGTLFSSSLFSGRAPKGFVTLTSYVGGTRAPELALRPEGELAEMTVADLRRLLGVRGKPTFVHCALYPKAIPQYELGYGRFKELMDRVEARAPGVFFAGHYREGISLSDSLQSGLRAAARIAAFLGKDPRGSGPAC